LLLLPFHAHNGVIVIQNTHTCLIAFPFQNQSGRAASWAVAIVGVAAYTFWTNYDNGQAFTKEDQSKWNAAKDDKR